MSRPQFSQPGVRATYVLGDVQGCWGPLQELLRKIKFDPDQDQIWSAGDLVNRGEGSRQVLAWAMDLGDAFRGVIGNHELHLLGRALGLREPGVGDTLQSILDWKRLDEALEWVRRLPLLFEAEGHLLVHAGFLPSWSVEETRARARFVEAALRGEEWRDLVAGYQEKKKRIPEVWQESVETLKVLTGVRMVRPDGRPLKKYKGAPEAAPEGSLPWYHRLPKMQAPKVLFGHWAAHGFASIPGGVCLDSGCVWGGHLTALRLEDGAVFTAAASASVT